MFISKKIAIGSYKDKTIVFLKELQPYILSMLQYLFLMLKYESLSLLPALFL